MRHPLEHSHSRVLAIVEDSRLRETLDRGLTRHGFGISFTDRPETLQPMLGSDVAAPEFDVVLLDLQPASARPMLAAAHALRTHGFEVPIVSLASVAMGRSLSDADVVLGLLLVKPIDLAELASELGALARAASRK